MKDKTKMFLKWLKDKEVYEQYKENYCDIEKRFPKYHDNMSFNQFFYDDIGESISWAFRWQDTPEGWLYWNEIDKKYRKLIINNNWLPSYYFILNELLLS